MNDKISVITVSYNRKDDLEKTIKSVVNQDYVNKEYIIIDGGSTDGTIEVIKNNIDKIDYWISEKDTGIYDAMNKGIKAASGKWINFMNAGDSFYDETVLSSVANALDPEATIAYGQLMRVYKQFRFIYDLKVVDLESVSLPHQAMFTKTDYHKNHLFDISYRSAADYKFCYIAHFVDGCKFQYLPFLIANYDSEHGMSKDSHISPMEVLRVRGIKLGNMHKIKLILRFKIINMLKRFLPECIITWIRKRKFTNAGYKIIEN